MGACMSLEVQPQAEGFRSPCYDTSLITLTLDLPTKELTSVASRAVGTTNRIFEYTSLVNCFTPEDV